MVKKLCFFYFSQLCCIPISIVSKICRVNVAGNGALAATANSKFYAAMDASRCKQRTFPTTALSGRFMFQCNEPAFFTVAFGSYSGFFGTGCHFITNCLLQVCLYSQILLLFFVIGSVLSGSKFERRLCHVRGQFECWSLFSVFLC